MGKSATKLLKGKTPGLAATTVMTLLEDWSVELEGPRETKLLAALIALREKVDARIRSI